MGNRVTEIHIYDVNPMSDPPYMCYDVIIHLFRYLVIALVMYHVQE